MIKNTSHWQEKILLEKLSYDNLENHELDQNCLSVKNLLEELETNLEEAERGKGHLHLQLGFKRRFNSHYGDYLLFHGKINGIFYAHCIRCLAPTQCPLNADFSACFLPHSYERREEYQDITSIYIDGEERELYFHHNGIADLQEILHENIFINVDPLPLHHPDCRGICPVCGINLNTAVCSH